MEQELGGNLRWTWVTIDLPRTVPILSQFRAAPNLLTLTRLFIIPFLLIEILDGNYRLAFTLFILAGVSDALDGLLARLLRQKTTLGQYLDPIADKLLLSTLFVVLTHVELIPRYVTVLVFSRDVGILLISTLLYMTNTLRDFRPSLLGKLNTLTQIVALIAVLCQKLFVSGQLTMLRDFLLRTVAVMAPLSAAQYAWIVFRRINASQEETAV
ncbi:MAG TPA: CDP-alcohol phosphatidyltransferase family protein [Edaphobacter sp.]|jgi:cardiolipin synthase|nr:CDP-alcohol phosphatidyltransferase family protein [Edaphobacter sp.]